MKRTLSMIALAVLTVGLLGSCSKINERLDNLEKKVDGIENEQIASINTQIAGIESSIADLKQIRSDVGNLKQTAESHGEDIFALQEADETLGNRIDNLEDYLENVLPNYAEKEWVEATFSTLEQYDSTCTAIAEINVKIGELDTKIAKDIKTCVDSMKTWVNEQLDAYYTAAEMNAELAKMKSAIDSAKASGKISDTKADSVARELTKTKTAVDTAKSNIRSEYKAAIKTAIDSSEGKLTKQIQDEIEKVNGKITNLSVRVDALYDDVRFLAGKVTALENMIQSVTIVPAFSDGSVILEDDILLYVDFIVSPAGAVDSLGKEDINILLNKVENTSLKLDTIPNGKIRSFVKDRASGAVSLKIAVNEYVPEPKQSISIAVNVNDGFSDNTTEFVNTTFVIGYVEIAAKYDGVNVTTRKWAKQNISISKSARREFLQTGHFNGDYFQWAAYVGYAGDPNDADKGLLLYTDFSSKCCGDDEDKIIFRPGEDKKYQFYIDNKKNNGISPHWSDSKYTKYTKTANNDGDNMDVLESDDDVASVTLGESWRMPTSAEFQAMKDTTYWAWDATDQGCYVFKPGQGTNGTAGGCAVIADTDNKADALLFFPAAGSCYQTGFSNSGKYGYYWSRSLFLKDKKQEEYACELLFYLSTQQQQLKVLSQQDGRHDGRYFGFSIRPVSE